MEMILEDYENLLPREKALQFGIEALSDKELLAVLIGSGGKDNSVFEIVDSLIRTYGSLGVLFKVNYRDLIAQKGLKYGKVLRLLAAFEIHARLNRPEYKMNIILDDTYKIYRRYHYLENYDQEILCLVMLNKKRRILKEKILYQGTSEGFNLDVKEVMSEVLISKSSSFLLLHNHVEDEHSPSMDDIVSTRIIKNSAEKLGVRLLDHLIIYNGGYYSFKEDKKI